MRRGIEPGTTRTTTLTPCFEGATKPDGLVFDGAFTGTAATGGFVGSTFIMALRFGVARGLFSNEAGLGSAPMLHAAAQTDHPVRQGLYGTFRSLRRHHPRLHDDGTRHPRHRLLAQRRDRRRAGGQRLLHGLPGTWGNIVVTTSLVLFAFSTVIGWSYYGETGVVYLLGARAAGIYRILWIVFIYLGAVGSLHLVWDIADTFERLDGGAQPALDLALAAAAAETDTGVLPPGPVMMIPGDQV